MDNWISVKDRLPEFHIEVLTINTHGEYFLAVRDEIMGFVDSVSYEDEIEKIEYWQHIEAPKQKKESSSD